jgi:hypothetical protein
MDLSVNNGIGRCPALTVSMTCQWTPIPHNSICFNINKL